MPGFIPGYGYFSVQAVLGGRVQKEQAGIVDVCTGIYCKSGMGLSVLFYGTVV